MMAATEEKHSGDGFGSPERVGLPAKPGAGQKRLEIGYRFMPNASMKKLTRANAKEKNPLAKLRLLACLFRKRGHSIRRICKEMVMPYSTVRDWLVRVQERGMGARFNRRHRGRKCKLPGSLFRTVRKWLNREPKKYGFESGSWQPSLRCDS